MRPILFHFGQTYYYLHAGHFMLFLGGLAALIVVRAEIKRMRAEPDKIYLLLLLLAVASVYGARILYCLDFQETYQYGLLDILRFWKGGMALHGGILLALATYFVYINRQGLDFWQTGDLLAPAVAAFILLARIGCILVGCCYGKQCAPGFPLALTFTDPAAVAPKHVPLYPTQPMFAAAALAVFLVLWLKRKSKRFDGEIALLGAALYSFLAFVIEFFRGDLRVLYTVGGIALSQNQILGAAIIIASCALYVYRRREAKGSPERSEPTP